MEAIPALRRQSKEEMFALYIDTEHTQHTHTHRLHRLHHVCSQTDRQIWPDCGVMKRHAAWQRTHDLMNARRRCTFPTRLRVWSARLQTAIFLTGSLFPCAPCPLVGDVSWSRSGKTFVNRPVWSHACCQVEPRLAQQSEMYVMKHMCFFLLVAFIVDLRKKANLVHLPICKS